MSDDSSTLDFENSSRSNAQAAPVRQAFAAGAETFPAPRPRLPREKDQVRDRKESARSLSRDTIAHTTAVSVRHSLTP